MSHCEHTVFMVTVKTVRSGLWRSGAVTVSLGTFPDRRLRPLNAGAPSGECVCFQWQELRRAHGQHTCTNTQALTSKQKLKGFVYVDLDSISPTWLMRRLLRHRDTSRSGSNSNAYRIVFKQPKRSCRIWSDVHLIDVTRASEFCTRRNQKWSILTLTMDENHNYEIMKEVCFTTTNHITTPQLILTIVDFHVESFKSTA